MERVFLSHWSSYAVFWSHWSSYDTFMRDFFNLTLIQLAYQTQDISCKVQLKNKLARRKEKVRKVRKKERKKDLENYE